MDGVLVDWDGGVERLFGMSIAEVRECYPDKRERYERIVALDPDFYQNLRWMPEGAVLWKFLEPFGPVLLTAYSKYVPRGASLKAAWAKRELGLPPDRVLAYSNKGEKRQHALNPDGSANVLVDDEPPNVDDWVAAGGLGILHTSTAETIRRLEKLGFARPD